MKKKIIYIVSEIDKSLFFEWISLPLSNRYNLKYILISKDNTALEKFLKQINITVYPIPFNNKKDIIGAWIKVFKILLREKPDIIHSHLWISNIICLPVAWLLGIQKRIFTRHHAFIHHREYPSGLKWDKLCNLVSTDIIAISENIKSILVNIEGVKATKIHLIHQGFDLNYFKNVSTDRIAHLKKKLSFPENKNPIIGVIARYAEYKGIQFIIPAFMNLLNIFPESLLILSNARGDYTPEVKKLLKQLPSGSYIEILFEEDLAALYHLFDIYVHVPMDAESEAFGQTYIESLASGVPSIFSLSGVAREFIIHEENALVVKYKNPNDIYFAVVRILHDDILRDKLIQGGFKSLDRFALNIMMDKLYQLYE